MLSCSLAETLAQAYVRDLEEKIKTYDESSITSSESMTDLKREITRFKDTEAQSSKYIADLEARLSRSDQSILTLQQTVERLEKESERRREEAETLQARLDSLRQDGENWRSDLEAREMKVKQLEEKMREWEQKKKEAGEARVRLGEVVGEVESARRSLEINIENAPSEPTSAETSDQSPNSPPSPMKSLEGETPMTSPASDIESQLLALQQTHTATLADLSSVTSKYRDALREISDLAAQIQEAKLNSTGITETIAEVSTESPASEKSPESVTFRRRVASGRGRDSGESQLSSSGRRLFFRQAASAESLHARHVIRFHYLQYAD